MKMSDLTQTCCERECGASFVISEGEQTFFVQNNMQLPRRCRECRERRKAARQGSAAPAPARTPSPAPAAVFSDGRGDREYAPAKKRRRWENDEDSDYSGRRR